MGGADDLGFVNCHGLSRKVAGPLLEDRYA